MSRVLSLTDEQRDQIARESLDHGQMLDSAFAAGVEAATEAIYRSPAQVYQDFLVRCRQYGLHGRSLDLSAFKRKLASVRAGVDSETADTPEWDQALTVAAALSDDLQPVFLMIARAAHDQSPCPSNAQIARARGSRSPRRALGLLEHMESQGLIATDIDAYGNRTIAVPALGWRTQPGNPDAEDAEDVA